MNNDLDILFLFATWSISKGGGPACISIYQEVLLWPHFEFWVCWLPPPFGLVPILVKYERFKISKAHANCLEKRFYYCLGVSSSSFPIEFAKNVAGRGSAIGQGWEGTRIWISLFYDFVCFTA